MPNIIGGSQTHPAYKPRKLEPNECLIDNRLYTATKSRDGYRVTWEDLDGSTGVAKDDFSPGIPGALKRYIQVKVAEDLAASQSAPKRKRKP